MTVASTTRTQGATGAALHFALQGLRQHPLQPAFCFPQPIKQPRASDLGHAHGMRPRGDILQGKIRHCIRPRQAQQGLGIGNVATAQQRFALPRRVFQIAGEQRENIGPFSFVVQRRRLHVPEPKYNYDKKATLILTPMAGAPFSPRLASIADRLQKRLRGRHLLLRRGTFIFDVIALDPGSDGRVEDGRPVELPHAERHA